MINIVWIVGLYIPIDPVSDDASIDGKWEIEGIYYTEPEARSACKVLNNFYAPIEIGKDLSGIDLEWPGLVYPLIEDYSQ